MTIDNTPNKQQQICYNKTIDHSVGEDLGFSNISQASVCAIA